MNRGILSGVGTAVARAAQATADAALSLAGNTRQMVLNRDPRLTTLEGVASAFTAATAAADQVHAALAARADTMNARIDAVINDVRARFAALPAPATSTTQIEYRDGVTVPPIASLLGSVGTTDVAIIWPTPFPDATYLVTVQVSTAVGALIGKTTAAVKTKTATGCTVTVSATAVLAAGQATLSAVAYRNR